MLNDPVLINDWHVVALASELHENKTMAVRLLNDYTVEITDTGITAKDITVWQPDPDGTGRGGNVTYTYQVHRPFTASFVKSSLGPHFAMFLYHYAYRTQYFSGLGLRRNGLQRFIRRSYTCISRYDYIARCSNRRITASRTSST